MGKGSSQAEGVAEMFPFQFEKIFDFTILVQFLFGTAFNFY